MKDLPVKLRFFIGLLAVLACLITVMSLSGLDAHQWKNLMLFSVFVLVADLVQVQISRGVYVSMSITLIMVAVATAGTEVGVLAGLGAAVLVDLFKGKPWFKVLFNGSQFTIMAWSMGIVLQYILDIGQWHFHSDPIEVGFAFFVCGLVGSTLNILMTAVPIAIDDQQDYFRVVLDIAATTLPVFPMQVLLAITLAYTYINEQYTWFTLLLTMLGLMFYSYHANRRMTEAARLARTVLGNINVGVITVDDRGTVNMVNPHACQLFTTCEQAARGQSFASAFPQGYLQILIETLQTGKIYQDYEVQTETGQYYRLETAQLTEGGGRAMGAIIFVQDITERKQWEEQIIQAEKLSIVGELAAGTAHEIRNPLTSVKGFIQLLNQRFDQIGMTKEKGYTDIIMSELDRINVIISEFLAFSKPLKPDLRIIDVKTILDELAIFTESEALLKNINLETFIESGSPLLVVEIDQIKQVFLNLIGNAFAAMPDGGTLRIIVQTNAESEEVEIAFVDSGVGIPAEYLGRIFEPFFTTREKGTGLGLTVTYRIIQNHGGTIEVDSTPGRGTTFTVRLPGRSGRTAHPTT